MVAQHGFTVMNDYFVEATDFARVTPGGIFFCWKIVHNRKSVLRQGESVLPPGRIRAPAGANPRSCRRGEFAPQLPCRGVYARSCQKATALAAATLSESTPQAMGMRTV